MGEKFRLAWGALSSGTRDLDENMKSLGSHVVGMGFLGVLGGMGDMMGSSFAKSHMEFIPKSIRSSFVGKASKITNLLKFGALRSWEGTFVAS